MQKLTSEIIIGNYNFDFCTNIEIESSWTNLTDTCKIIIPKKISLQGQKVSDNIFKDGDLVNVKLGYDGVNYQVFKGFVNMVNPKLPLEIYVEDFMWLFKRVNITKSYPSVSLSQLINDLMDKVKTSPFYPASGIEVIKTLEINNLGKIRLNFVTIAQVFEMLRNDYGVQSFFRDGKLYVGLAYVPSLKVEKKFKFQWDIIEDDLIYLNVTDYKVKIKAISITDNRKIEYETGDPDGEVRTYHYYGLSQTELKTIANNELSKIKYNGWQGNFKTFFTPFVRHNDAVVFEDKILPERNGTYLIKKVTYDFGIDGGFQDIELDQKIA